jgi:hypothetical protein
MITQQMFDALIPGSIVRVQDSFTVSTDGVQSSARAVVVKRDLNSNGLYLSVDRGRGIQKGGYGGPYSLHSVVSVEFDMGLITDFLKNVAKCPDCESCRITANDILNYVKDCAGAMA